MYNIVRVLDIFFLFYCTKDVSFRLHQVEEPLLETKTAYGVFENFGPIQELIVRRPLKQILVKFARKESVKKAIKYQTVLGYKVHVVTSGASYNEDQKIEYSRHTYNEIDLTDEVKAELDGMGGGPSMGIVNKINRIGNTIVFVC